MAVFVVKKDLGALAQLNLNTNQGLLEADADALYLRLDGGNVPTATINTQTLVSDTASAYDIGSAANPYGRVYADTASFHLERAGSVGTKNYTLGSTSYSVGMTKAGTGATYNVSLGTAVNVGSVYNFGGVAWAEWSGDVATLQITGTSGTNFGSAITLLSDTSGVTASISLTGSGCMNLGSAIPEGAGDATILLSGDACLNVGSVQGAGGSITLAGNTQSNFGAAIDGTISYGALADHSYNFGVCENGGTITVAGLGSANLARIDVGDLIIDGDNCVNVGAIDGVAATIDFDAAGDNSVNFMTLSGAGSLNFNAPAQFAQGQSISTAAITLGQSGNLFRGSVGAGGTITIGGIASYTSVYSTTPLTLTHQSAGGFLSGFMNGNVTSTGDACMVVGRLSTFSTSSYSFTGRGNFFAGHLNSAAGQGGNTTVSGNGNWVGLYCEPSPSIGSHGANSIGGRSHLILGCFDTYVYDGVTTNNNVVTTSNNAGIGVARFAGSAGGTGQLTLSGNGVIAGGNCVTQITASGNGSIAWGDSTSAAIVASATNAFQFGGGTNSVALSLQVGAAGTGIRIFGSATGAPGANGAIWLNGSSQFAFQSNGQTILLYRDAGGQYVQTYATADRTHAARTAAGLTPQAHSGTPDTTLAATGTTVIDDNFHEVSLELDRLRADQIDTAQFLNALVDHLQALNIIQI